MKYYAEFYEESTGINSPKHPIPACGTDAVYNIDGRLDRLNKILAAKVYYNSIAKFHPNYIGFIIYRGYRFKGTPITDFIFLN